MTRPTLERVRQLLRYNPVNGEWRWRIKPAQRILAGSIAGCVRPNGYRMIGFDNGFHQSSRLAFLVMTGSWPTKFIDHINRDRSDDRWANLREASAQQNQRNRPPLSGYKGVSLHRSGRFRARINVNEREVALGFFNDPADAARAYDDAARRHFGEFAYLNFPAEVTA